MYVAPHFAESDLSQLDALVERDPFVTLTTCANERPFASHVPVLYQRAGNEVVIRGHWARANPQRRHALDSPALIIIHGPHAYISPTGYVDPQRQVPTWNYAVAHLHGTLELLDPAMTEQVVVDLAQRFEGTHANAWQFGADHPDRGAGLRHIVGFRLRAADIQIKLKLNQNHPRANVEGAAAALLRRTDDNARDTAQMMLDALGRRTTDSR